MKLFKTCSACPEQYDAYLNEEQVGYLRLRHGYFTVQYPDVNGKVIYESYTKGDGMFFDEEERIFELVNAKLAILNTLKEG